jgi:hypothetical protein
MRALGAERVHGSQAPLRVPVLNANLRKCEDRKVIFVFNPLKQALPNLSNRPAQLGITNQRSTSWNLRPRQTEVLVADDEQGGRHPKLVGSGQSVRPVLCRDEQVGAIPVSKGEDQDSRRSARPRHASLDVGKAFGVGALADEYGGHDLLSHCGVLL